MVWIYKHDPATTLPYPALLYSSPFTDFSPHGVDGVFAASDADAIVSILRSVIGTAAA